MEVLPVDHPILLGEPVRIKLRIQGSNFTDISGTESQGNPPNYLEFRRTLQLATSPEDGTYITIIPMRLGKLTLALRASFSDGGSAYKAVSLNVNPTAKKPELLMVGVWEGHM